jgi:hypothetical protein
MEESNVMRITMRLVMTALIALSAFAFFAGSAAASRALSITARGLITLASNGAWTFKGSPEVICQRVSLLISLRTEQVAKAAAGRLPEGQIGNVQEGRATECRDSLFGSEVRTIILARKPTPSTYFPLRYDAFLGTLPAINGILLTALNGAFSFTNALIGTCLYRGNVGNLIALNGSGQTTENRYLANRIPKQEGGGGCPASGELIGRGTISPVLTIRLI